MNQQRCGWCSSDPLYIAYHDHEWGKPQFDEQHLFEMLCLEGQQAGLSWITVLKKRESYRQHSVSLYTSPSPRDQRGSRMQSSA